MHLRIQDGMAMKMNGIPAVEPMKAVAIRQ